MAEKLDPRQVVTFEELLRASGNKLEDLDKVIEQGKVRPGNSI